ncbi:MAG: aldo/keto reductase [Hyphomicrobiaceae bacterium]
MSRPTSLTRRQALQLLTSVGTIGLSPLTTRAATNPEPLRKRIPSTGEAIPPIGMGTWITFNVGNDREARAARAKVLKTFFAMGGRVIDSSPMYGSSEAVVGDNLETLGFPDQLFAATKVWTSGKNDGQEQMKDSLDLWRIKKFDLLQIHNLLDWETHIETLKEMKAAGQVRYIGITTSHGRRHGEFEKIMTSVEDIDFVQLTYNIEDRAAEQRLLPVAQERNLAVITNRPFQRGGLFRRVGKTPLPNWAKDAHAANWPEFFLKFVISHPAVTCAIPATSKVAHMKENMSVLNGPLPDPDMRKKMAQFIDAL